MLPLGLVDGGIEFDQHLARFDALAVTDPDGTYHAGLERLDHLGAAAGDDLSRRRGDDIDLAERRPSQCQAE